MATSNPYSEYFKAVKGCSTSAQKDFMKIWAMLDLTKPDEARDILLKYVPPLVDKYGSAAATAAAEMYEAVKIAELGVYEAATMSATMGASAERSVRYAVGLIYEGKTEEAMNSLLLAVDYYSKQPGRETIYFNVAKDKKYGARYARVPQGPTTCEFCIMLASRGFVYQNKMTAGDGMNKYHTSCDCMPVVSFANNPVVPGYDQKHYEQLYMQMQDKGKWNRAHEKKVQREKSNGTM